jgi:hypothetical protein
MIKVLILSALLTFNAPAYAFIDIISGIGLVAGLSAADSSNKTKKEARKANKRIGELEKDVDRIESNQKKIINLLNGINHKLKRGSKK